MCNVWTAQKAASRDDAASAHPTPWQLVGTRGDVMVLDHTCTAQPHDPSCIVCLMSSPLSDDEIISEVSQE